MRNAGWGSAVGMLLMACAGEVGAADGGSIAVGPTTMSQGAQVPSEAKPLVPLLHEATQLFNAVAEKQRVIKRLEVEQDAARTRLTTVNEELTLQTQHRQRLLAQLEAAEAERLSRVEALRKELEAKMEGELRQASQQLDEEFSRELTAHMEQFDARRRGEIEQALQEELQLQERALEQTAQEVQAQTESLTRQLTQLQVSPEAVNGMVKSTGDALTKRREALKERRATLHLERESRLSQSRADVLARFKRQQEGERHSRLTIKEASLRQGMAELLNTASLQEAAHVERLQQSVEELTRRYSSLSQEQASLRGRLEMLEKDLALQAQQLDQLQARHQGALVTLEQAFQQPVGEGRTEGLVWLSQVAGQLPSELGGAIISMHERLLVRAEQERQLREQQRVFRERQLAMQVSQQLEAQRQDALAKRQREDEARGRKADELMTKAKQVAARGDFEGAFAFISQAHELGPPQLGRVTELREELIAAQAEARTAQQVAAVERLFARAMEVFEAGRYEEAVPLFEQVIAMEAELERPTRLAETRKISEQ